MNNLEFWNKYKEVPKNALKDFDNGKFKGTDINTIWRLKCLTETFGMCGFGWYYKPIRMWTESCENGDVFAFAEIELFVKKDNEWSMAISGTGGNKLSRMTKMGDLSTSDEAFKMAITDAIGVACRNLGIGADVYWANDKTKYSEYATEKENDNNFIKGKDFKFSSGKFKGKAIEEVDKEDPEYLDKLLEWEKCPMNVRLNIEAYRNPEVEV